MVLIGQELSFESPNGSPYIYQSQIPTSSDKRFFRLLLLHPGQHSDTIDGSLVLYELDSCPVYEAVSYAWESYEGTLAITIDDKVLNITRNLRTALRYLRHPTDSRWLWVDSVCIQQNNLDERAAQVSMMRDIYRNAANVIIWAGPSYSKSDVILQLGNLLAEESERSETIKLDRTEWTKKTAESLGISLNAIRTINAETGNFLERAYFTRCWVLQEVTIRFCYCLLTTDR
jgi:Heterokaryon incompatibility protein (HET)